MHRRRTWYGRDDFADLCERTLAPSQESVRRRVTSGVHVPATGTEWSSGSTHAAISTSFSEHTEP